MKNRIAFEEVPPGIQFMGTIINVMCNGNVLVVEYQTHNWEQSKSISFEPCFLKLFRHRWYLVGVNREYKAFRSYPLDRVREIGLSEDTFSFPRKFTPQDHFRNSFGIIRDEGLVSQRIIPRAITSQVPHPRSLSLHFSQKEIAVTENCVDFELYIPYTYDFVQELLSKGAALEALEPRLLRDTTKDEIRNM